MTLCSVKKVSKLVLIICLTLPIFSCQLQSKGDHVLIVNVVNKLVENIVKPSELSVVKESLNRGGSINLNIDICRQIDNNFDQNYAIIDSQKQFMILPAVLNFVGGQGWNLITVDGNGNYYFTKKR